MNKMILALATLSTIAFSVPALAGDYDAGEHAAFAQTQRNEPALKLRFPTVVEGRNATIAPAVKLRSDAYINQQIELDARSER